MRNPGLQYKDSISRILGVASDKIFLYWKGRVGLYAILKSIGIGVDDEVIVQGFTCVVVSNAIIYLGAKPVYVDIEASTLNTSISLIRDAVTDNTKVIIVQNTFGLSSEINEISEFSKAREIITIEDCTHGFGGYFNGKPNGTICDAAFYSTQWNKSISTGIGGFLIVNNPELINSITRVNADLVRPHVKEIIGLRFLLRFYNTFMGRRSYWKLRNIYRTLSKLGFVIGSSKNVETTSIVIPGRYFKSACNVQAREGIRQLEKLNDLLELRKENAAIYTQYLKESGKTYVKEYLYDNHSFTKYPIFVKDRNRFMISGEQSEIPLDDWFCSPIHPVTHNLKQWGVELKDIPVAVKLSGQIVNLPTGIKNPDRILSFLQMNLDDLL